MKMTSTTSLIPPRSIVLVGMMGAGKTAVGRKLASRLGWRFIDSDTEIEAAAGMSITQIFDSYGEPAFRDGERRVIARLLGGDRCVLSTGGGAFMDADTRTLIAAEAISVWLKADIDILVQRTAQRDDRPLLKGGDVRERLTDLLTLREPVYSMADIAVVSDDRPPEDTAERVLAALQNYVERDR
jgi:cytidylate kinase